MFPPETKILVVDDMSSVRLLVKNSLKTMGYKNVIEAGNGEIAFETVLKFHRTPEPVQLIISDWNMPELDGLSLFKKLRATDGIDQIPFIMLTSESEVNQVTIAILNGVSNYILKPFSPKVLEDKLRAVWQKHNENKQ